MISSNHQMNFELGAEFLERCESLLTEEDMTDSIGISLLIIKCHLYWYTERRAAEHQSKIDALTGLGNRFLLEENLAAHLEYAIARQQAYRHTVPGLCHLPDRCRQQKGYSGFQSG
jgi:GGDEF domain-containing protein